jgi:hypothetical protein
MGQLRFKKEQELEKGRTYSVCLRGARKYNYDIEGPNTWDLEIFFPSSEKRKHTAEIVSQAQFRFFDLTSDQCENNYDVTARSTQGLHNAMVNVYPDFNPFEIVTLLNFKIQ